MAERGPHGGGDLGAELNGVREPSGHGGWGASPAEGRAGPRPWGGSEPGTSGVAAGAGRDTRAEGEGELSLPGAPSFLFALRLESAVSVAREAACLDKTHGCLWPEAATCRLVLSARPTLGTSKDAAPRGARLTQLALERNCRKPGRPQVWRDGGFLPLLCPPPALVTQLHVTPGCLPHLQAFLCSLQACSPSPSVCCSPSPSCQPGGSSAGGLPVSLLLLRCSFHPLVRKHPALLPLQETISRNSG